MRGTSRESELTDVLAASRTAYLRSDLSLATRGTLWNMSALSVMLEGRLRSL